MCNIHITSEEKSSSEEHNPRASIVIPCENMSGAELAFVKHVFQGGNRFIKGAGQPAKQQRPDLCATSTSEEHNPQKEYLQKLYCSVPILSK